MNDSTPSQNMNSAATNFNPLVRIPVGRRRSDRNEPEISLEKDEDRIVKIVLKCRCGEELTIECNYPEPTPKS